MPMKEWRLRGVTTHDVVGAQMSTSGRTDGSEPSLRALVDQFPGVLWTTDPDLMITSIVGRGLAGLGLGPNQLVGTNLEELFDAPPAPAAHRRALLGEAVSFPLHLGDQRYHARVAPLSDASGRTLGVIGMALDTARIDAGVRYAEAVAAAG
jgi:PAS domain-containing protein